MPAITIDELNAIQAPAPTKTWNPVPHYEVMDVVQNSLATIGIDVIDTQIHSDKGGHNVFVTHKLDMELDKTQARARHPQIGWRNSTDKKFAIGFTSGTSIIVCENLVFSGSWLEFHKHNSKMDHDIIEVMTLKAINAVIVGAVKGASWHNSMLEQVRGQHHADHLFMEMLRTGVVSSKQIMDLSNGFDEERGRYGDTLYSIYNAATQTFRSLALPTISERSTLLNKLIRQDMAMEPIIEVEAIAA